MRLLLDTQVWLWYFSEPKRINESTFATITDHKTQAYVSALSVWEAAIKARSGRLTIPDNILTVTRSEGFIFLDFSPEAALKQLTVELTHRDPFDAGLVGQAISEDLTLVTADSRLLQDYAGKKLKAD